MKTIRTAISAAAVLALASVGATRAQEKISLLYQPVGGFVNAYVAADEGFFTKHGVEVTFQPTQVASNVIAVIESGQCEIGGPTMLPVLQANEGGLDLVVLAGGAVYPLPGDGLVAATGSGIEHARDLAGKRVGVPGIGTQLHVLALRGLEESGVDPHSVKFVELGFLQSADGLKSRLVDAYTSVEPFTQRIVKAGAGKLLPDWPEIPDGTTTIVYTATRKWATGHRRAVDGFRAALREAGAFAPGHRDETIKALAHYTKLPLPVVQTMPISGAPGDLSPQQVQFWIDLGRAQSLIKSAPDPKRILFE